MTTADARSDGPTIFISAAEPSADQHAGMLIRAVRRKCPSARFTGVAGPAMRAEGCDTIADLSRHSAMLLEAIGTLGRAVATLAAVERRLWYEHFDAAVLIDSPALHLPMATHFRSRGIPILYYIAPQLWAWGANRIHRLRSRVDHLAVILPFEEAYFRDRGVPTTYVGHPLFDRVLARSPSPQRIAELRTIGDPVIGLLPGSRRHVVRKVIGGQLEVAYRLVRSFPRLGVLVSVAGDPVADIVDAAIRGAAVPVTVCRGENAELQSAADLLLVASGTATLEAATFGKPLIVMYNDSKWAYRLIGRHLINTQFLSLINILAGRKVVAEFMPYFDLVEPIVAEAYSLLTTPHRRREMVAALRNVVEPLSHAGASKRTAELLLAMISG